jgi:hypothetical protein
MYMTNRTARHAGWLLLMSLVASTTGCMRHAYFPESVRPAPMPAATTPLRFLYDRQGNLYPDSSVVVGGEGTIRPAGRWFRRQANWTLRHHFANTPRAWTDLATRYLRAPVPFTENAWRAVQDSIRIEGLRNIVARSRPGSPIVVLVHGFNTAEPERDRRDAFDVTRDSLTSWYGRQFPEMTFVEVRWDGLVGTGPGLVRRIGGGAIWSYAQANGYFVGMELRRVLAGLPHDRPVRILTHSLGAHVATAALWNVSSKLSGDILRGTITGPAVSSSSMEPWVRYFDGFSSPDYRTPSHPDLRLAMIVPAIPGLTFGGGKVDDYYDRNFAGRPPVRLDYALPDNVPSSTYDRIIVGQNSEDKIIDKFIGKPGLYGSTTLGGSRSEFSARVAPFLNGRPERNGGRELVAYDVDIREGFEGVDVTEHDWELYLRRRNIRDLTDCLFTERCDGPAVSTK